MNEDKFRYCNIDKWHSAGFTGKNVKIASFESFVTTHGIKVLKILKQVAPDAIILPRPEPGGIVIGSPEWIVAMTNFFKSLVAEGVNLVTMSLHGDDHPEYTRLQREYMNDISMFTSAGNNNFLTKAATTPDWFSIGACELVDGKPKIMDWSGAGIQLDFCGFTNLYYTINAYFTGTSCACPFVVGMVACWYQWFYETYGRYPTRKETYEFCMVNSEDMKTLYHDIWTGYGLVRLPSVIPIPTKEEIILNRFNDVLEGRWSYEAIEWCAENKIVEGYPDGLFKPEDNLTREQLAVVIYRFAKMMGLVK